MEKKDVGKRERSRRTDFNYSNVSKSFMMIISLIVEEPDKVECVVHESASSIIYEIYVSENDYGKIIGKGGAMARALRQIMRAIAGNFDKRLILEFSHK